MSAISEAIASQNVDLLKELLQAEVAARIANICEALANGNMEILQALMEKCPVDQQSMAQVLRSIPSVSHDEAKKLQMLQYLLPFYNPENSYSFTVVPSSLPNIILCYCAEKHFILADFLINEFYISDDSYNSFNSLIKKLRATVDGWYNICVFLHEDIIEIRGYPATDLRDAVKVFFQLLLKDTRESMELAAETFQLLLGRNFYEALEYHFFDEPMLEDNFFIEPGWDENISTEIEQALKDPLITKLLFQLIYNSMNAKVQVDVYQFFDTWLDKHSRYDRFEVIHNLSIQLFKPFISKPLCDNFTSWASPRYIMQFLRENPVQNGSLKELSREVVRCQVFQNVKCVKEFMDRIWEFELPLTLKCFLLHIPDPSWMNNLQMS